MAETAEVWTHGRWVVKAGHEEEFVAAWRELAEWTTANFPALRAVLLRDRDAPGHFYSFGPWPDLQIAEQWRASEGFGERVERIRALLDGFSAYTLDPAARVGPW